MIETEPGDKAAFTANVDPPTLNRLAPDVRLNVYGRVDPPTTEKSPTTVPTLEAAVTVALDSKIAVPTIDTPPNSDSPPHDI